jgi:hypothetical protein
LEEPPTIDVVYEADLEVPFVSQECRSFNWLATGPMCWPTRIESKVKATAQAGGYVFEIPVSVPGTIRHSLKSLNLIWSFDRQSIVLVDDDEGSRVAFWNESFVVDTSEDPGDIGDARVFQGRIADDRFAFGGEPRFGILQTGENWAIDRHALWLRNTVTLAQMKRSTTRRALAWYEGAERPFGDPPPHLRRGQGRGCREGGHLTVWLDGETLLWAEELTVRGEAGDPSRVPLRKGSEPRRVPALEEHRGFFFHRGQLLSLEELTSESTGRGYPGTTLATSYTSFRDGAPIEQTRMEGLFKVWRTPGATGAMAVNAPAPGGAWLAAVSACVARIHAVAATAVPLAHRSNPPEATTTTATTP